MSETVMERIEKEEADGQWEDYHDGSQDKPTERQLACIASLSERAGTEIDLDRIQAKAQASRIIAGLIQLERFRNSQINDKKAAFGLATKLVHNKYLELHHPVCTAKFWKDVEKLFRAYEQHLDKALGASLLEVELVGESPLQSLKAKTVCQDGGDLNGTARKEV